MAKKQPPNDRLAAGLKARAWSRTELAKRLGIDPSAVSRWVNGKAAPDPHHRLAMERLFGIPQNDWLSDKERAVVDRVAADRPRTGTHD